MKNVFKPTRLPLLILCAGGIGLLLRIWLLSTGVDDKGLLVSGHPAEILLWLLTAAVAAGLLYLTKDLVEAGKYRFNFPASDIGGIGAFLAAGGIGITALVELIGQSGTFSVVVGLLGLLMVPTLIFLGRCRQKGLRPAPVFHTVLSLYLMLRLIGFYRHWSSDPQLQDYCFQLLATVCLMLAVYQHAAFDAGIGRRRPCAFFSLAAVYFCCLSLTDWAGIPFFLGTGAWMVTNLCSLIPMPGRRLFRNRREEEP